MCVLQQKNAVERVFSSNIVFFCVLFLVCFCDFQANNQQTKQEAHTTKKGHMVGWNSTIIYTDQIIYIYIEREIEGEANMRQTQLEHAHIWHVALA